MRVTAVLGKPEAMPAVAVRTADDVTLETYLRHPAVTGYFEREARAMWHLYKQLTDNKPLKDATRDDGRKVAERFEAQGVKNTTIRKLQLSKPQQITGIIVTAPPPASTTTPTSRILHKMKMSPRRQ